MRLRSSANAAPGYVHPDYAGEAPQEDAGVGELLVREGVLTADDVRDILHHQERTGELFGEAAISLGKIDALALQQMLARHADFPVLAADDSRIDSRVVAAFDPYDPFAVDIRSIRSELSSRWYGDSEDDQRAVAVVAQDASVDISLIVANLAVVSAQLGWKTLLVDADLEIPVQHELFRADNRSGLSSLLQGAGEEEETLQPTAIERLSILPSGPAAPNSFELLEKRPLLSVLEQLGRRYRLIVAGISRINDGHLGALDVIFSGFDGVIVVVRRDSSSLRSVQRMIAELSERGLPVLGTVIDQ